MNKWYYKYECLQNTSTKIKYLLLKMQLLNMNLTTSLLKLQIHKDQV